MTPEQFNSWLSDMRISGVEAASLLGVQPNTISRYRRKGGPAMLGAACAHLRDKKAKDDDSEKATAIRDERKMRATTEAREFRVCSFVDGFEKRYAVAFGEPEGLPGGRVRVSARTIGMSTGKLGGDCWITVENRNLSFPDPKEMEALLRRFRSKPWVQKYALKHGIDWK